MKTCRIKKPRQATVLLGIMICLTGCANPKPTPITQASESMSIIEAAPQSEPGVEEIIPQNSANTEPTRIVETVNEDFYIDAEVIGNPPDGLCGVYTGEPKRFTKDEIGNFLSFCGNTIASAETSSDGYTDYYNGVCENGNVFYYSQDSHNHPFSQFVYRNDAEYQIYNAYPIYNGEQQYITNPKYTVGWMFMEPKDFSFATAAEAEQEVRSALKILGLSELKLLRTLYCDHQTLEAAMKRVTTNKDYAPLGDPQENNGYIIKEDWSEEDDAYVFSFGISVRGIPMSFRLDLSGETASYTGCKAYVWYTKNGIVFANIETPWTVGKEAMSPQPIISAEEALNKVKVKYEYDLVKRNKCIEEIRLEYQYVQDREHWILRPVWAVFLSYTRDGSDDQYASFTNIDALTGDEV